MLRAALVLLLLACTPPPERPRPRAPIDEKLAADVDTLEAIATALHPGLTRYRSEAEIRALFRDARERVGRAQNLGEVYLELTRLTAAFRCGHSYPNFWNQSKEIQAALFHGKRLPFLFRWIDGAMVVTEDLGASPPLAKGTRVLSLGGQSTASILATLLPLARADGGNDAKRRAYLEDRGEGSLEAFDVLAPLVFPTLFAGDTVDVELVRPDGTREARAQTLQTFEAHAAAVLALHPEPDKDAPLWTARRADRAGKRILYLPMPTWVAYKTTWDWRADLDRIAQSLVDDKIDGLVIDLRGNEGGNDVGDVLVAHLVDRPFVPRTLSRRVRFRSVPPALRGYLDTWDPSFFELGVDAKDLGGGWRELPPPDDAQIMPKAPRFTGAVVVLVDAANSSATFQFAQTVRTARLGLLVGTPTGGSQRGINGGAFFFAKLPNTGIEVDIPLVGTFPVSATPIPDQGIDPDVRVETTAAAIAAGRDPALEVALDRAAAGAR